MWLMVGCIAKWLLLPILPGVQIKKSAKGYMSGTGHIRFLVV